MRRLAAGGTEEFDVRVGVEPEGLAGGAHPPSEVCRPYDGKNHVVIDRHWLAVRVEVSAEARQASLEIPQLPLLVDGRPRDGQQPPHACYLGRSRVAIEPCGVLANESPRGAATGLHHVGEKSRRRARVDDAMAG